MTETAYVMSFTAGALLHRESLTVATLFHGLGDWDVVRDRVLDENLLQMRTSQAAKRIFREVSGRLKPLTPAELALLLDGAPQEQGHILWLAVCKRYRFIYDFAIEVVREKFIRLDFDLSYDDYDVFFNDKAEWHPEVEGVAESTRKKLRQVLFKMMREANLLTQDDQIVPAMLTPRTIEVIAAGSPSYLLAFPISPTEVQEWLS
ncbi:MAG TPA: DUF1819 family protein [Chloroflexi bacterium]|nr:DUF1819 family protein [Chloroflexota bacterium]